MRHYNAQWYIAEKMKETNFNAAQKSIIAKHLREYADFKESLQRELCALTAYRFNVTPEIIREIRESFPIVDEVHNIRKQMQAIRKQYKEHFMIAKEFSCLGKYLHQIAKNHDNIFIDPKKKYIVRIFTTGEVYIFNPDKPSQFYESTFIMNANNLRKIKKSLLHLSSIEANNEFIELILKSK